MSDSCADDAVVVEGDDSTLGHVQAVEWGVRVVAVGQGLDPCDMQQRGVVLVEHRTEGRVEILVCSRIIVMGKSELGVDQWSIHIPLSKICTFTLKDPTLRSAEGCQT